MYGALDRKGVLAALAFTAFSLSLGASESTDALLSIPVESQGSEPAFLTVSGDFLYFSADDGVRGRELWKLNRDGEAAMVFDIPDSSDPHHFQDVGGTLYFFDGFDRLWATEGDAVTTRFVSSALAKPAFTASLGNKLIFGGSGHLWVSSGTPGTTHQLSSNTSDHTLTIETGPGGLVFFDNRVFFRAICRQHGPRIWVSDGTTAGTQPLRDDEGKTIECSGRVYLETIELDGALYVTSGGNRAGFWKIAPESPVANQVFAYATDATTRRSGFSTAGRSVIFAQSDLTFGMELWRISPTFDREERLLDIYPGRLSSGPYAMRALKDYTVFVAVHPETGTELWRTDGTTAGTQLLKDLVPGVQDSNPYQLLRYKDWVLFACENYTIGEELWRTDGTTEGTMLVKDINPSGDAEPYYLTTFNGKVYFNANHHAYGQELWESDGTAEGTRVAARIKPALRSVNAASPKHLTAFQDTLYFTIVNARGTRELWLARESETWPAQAINQALSYNDTIEQIHVRNNVLYLETWNSDLRSAFWKLDPLNENVHNVDTIPTMEESQPLRALLSEENYGALVPRALRNDQWARANGKVFFVAHTPEHGSEMWVFDEQDPEPVLLHDIVPGPASSSPEGILSTGTYIVFRAEHITKGCQLWISDGTADGTHLLFDAVNKIPFNSTDEMTITDDGLLVHVLRTSEGRYDLAYIEPTYGTENQGLWTNPDSKPSSLTSVGNTVYVVVTDPAVGEELWHIKLPRSDDGLVRPPPLGLVKDIRPNSVYDPLLKQWIPALPHP